MAEREGLAGLCLGSVHLRFARPIFTSVCDLRFVEPREPCGPAVFKTAAIDHSAPLRVVSQGTSFSKRRTCPAFLSPRVDSVLNETLLDSYFGWNVRGVMIGMLSG